VALRSFLSEGLLKQRPQYAEEVAPRQARETPNEQQDRSGLTENAFY